MEPQTEPIKTELTKTIEQIRGIALPVLPIPISVRRITEDDRQNGWHRNNRSGWVTEKPLVRFGDIPTINIPCPTIRKPVGPDQVQYSSHECIVALSNHLGFEASESFTDGTLPPSTYDAFNMSRFGIFRFESDQVTSKDVLAFFTANHIKRATTRDLLMFEEHYKMVVGDKLIALGCSNASQIELATSGICSLHNIARKIIGSKKYIDPRKISYPMLAKPRRHELRLDLTHDHPTPWNCEHLFLGKIMCIAKYDEWMNRLAISLKEYRALPTREKLPKNPFCKECLGKRYVTEQGWVCEIIRGEEVDYQQALLQGFDPVHTIPDYAGRMYRPVFTELGLARS